jgi:DNA repair protein RadD
MDLRLYQAEACKAALDSIATQGWSLVEVPTGGGKTIIIKEVAARVSHLQILVITPRKKLLKQFQASLPPNVGIMSSSYGNDDGSEHELVLATSQTAIARLLKTPDVILIDECHLLAQNSAYWKWLKQFPKAKVIGFTATPYRGQKHIKEVGWNPIYKISVLDLVIQKYLVPPRSMATGAPAASFESNNSQKTNLLLPPLLLKVKELNQRRIAGFCQDIAHAQHVMKQLAEMGETSVSLVHSKMNDADIEEQYANFTKAEGRSWLINVTLVSIGVDIPCIDSIVILRDVSSYSLFVQMVGRGLRPFDGKSECLIFDFGAATSRFKFIDHPDFNYRDRESGGGSGQKFPPKVCRCGALNPANAKRCSRCGLELFESKLNATSSDASLLSTPIYVEILHDFSVAKISEFEWETTYGFRGGAISAKTYTSYPPGIPILGNQFLLEMLEPDYAVILEELS